MADKIEWAKLAKDIENALAAHEEARLKVCAANEELIRSVNSITDALTAFNQAAANIGAAVPVTSDWPADGKGLR